MSRHILTIPSTTGVEVVGGGRTVTLATLTRGIPGASGSSAYQVAVTNGFVGTEAEWLASLQGNPGNTGQSAYQVAVTNGFVGTEAEWLVSLQGDPGEPAAVAAYRGTFNISPSIPGYTYIPLIKTFQTGFTEPNNTTLTAITAGAYYVFFDFVFNAQGIGVQIHKNGVLMASFTSAGPYGGVSGSTLLNCHAGDQIRLYLAGWTGTQWGSEFFCAMLG